MQRGKKGGSGLYNAIRWLDIVLPNYDEAEKYIESHDRGNYDQIAVKYNDYSGCGTTARMRELEKKANLLYQTYQARAQLAFKDIKSAFRSCPNCSSKLAVKYLKTNQCPVCYKDLRSDTALTAEQNTYAKWQKALLDIENENKKPRKGGKVKWLIKIEYHV